VKLARRGFGPAAELPYIIASVTASPRLQFATRLFERHWRQPPRRFGTRDRPHSLQQRTFYESDCQGRVLPFADWFSVSPLQSALTDRNAPIVRTRGWTLRQVPPQN
jgi:hypothetical protein